MSGFYSRAGRRQAAGPILIVDDDADDAKLSRRAVETSMPGCDVRILDSGKALLAYFEKKGEFASRQDEPQPSAVLLDLRMPEMDGFEVMEWLGKNPTYENIPVVVLSALNDLPKLKRAYALRARAYLLKPVNVESIRSILTSLNISC